MSNQPCSRRRESAWMLPIAILLLFPFSATAASLSSVTVNPKTIVSGSPVEITFALDRPAPPGGAAVTLSSSNAAIVGVPISWGIAAGAVSNGVMIRQTGFVSSTATVTITASLGGVNKTAALMVTPRQPLRGVAGDFWADVILGQPDFGEITFNEVNSKRVFNPGGVIVDRSVSPNRVYVYDSTNSRILGMNHLGACSGGTKVGQPCTSNPDCPASTCAIQEGRGADLVLGQPAFDRSACNGDSAFQLYPKRAPASAATLCSLPEDVVSVSEAFIWANMAVDGAGNLYVPDFQNHRVLRYNSPFTTDTIADDVWGQADFAGNSCNRGRGLDVPDAQSLCLAGPRNGFTAGVAIDSAGNLWVADHQNNRVLRFPRDPVTGIPKHTADLVLGQPDFVSSASGPAPNQMWGPAAVRVDSGGTVYVADSRNNRVLTFTGALSNGMTAGQLSYAFWNPTGLELDPAGGIWVNDAENDQLLLFVGGAIQKVLFKDVATSPGGCGGNFAGDRPYFTYDDGTGFPSWRLCVTGGSIGIDSAGNIFASGNEAQDVWRFPAPIPAPAVGIAHSADARLFKPYQFSMPNEVGLAGLYAASGVAVAAGQLIASDAGRLLFWNGPPNLTNGQPADGYVGQTSPRLQKAPYFGRIREDSSSRLWAVRGDQIVAYSLPLHTGDSPVWTISPPLSVLGGGTISWDYLLQQGGIAPVGAGDKVWIADPQRSRVFRIKNALTTPVVDIVLGQKNLTETGCNQGRGLSAPSDDSLCYASAVRLDPQGNLYVSDAGFEAQGNSRLLEYASVDLPDPSASALFAVKASHVFGTGGSFTGRSCLETEFCHADFEPAFTSNGQMVVGGSGYLNPRFPFVFTNPLVSQQASTFLNDFTSHPGAATFDSSNNLYLTDGNRGRVSIYLNPLSSPPPATYLLTVTKSGTGTGTVKSTPFGIDCGTKCSQLYIDGTSVTLSIDPGPGSTFSGWSGDPDCSDGIVTMSGPKTCTARFVCAVLAIAPSSLPSGSVGVPYSQTLTASGGIAPYTFAVQSGSLPPPLLLTSAGVLSGTPTTAGSYTFTVRATDSVGCTGTRTYTVIICGTITLNPSSLPPAWINVSYSQTLTAAGGTSPYTFTRTSGALPPGLSLASNGVISGLPTTAGSFTFTAKATDARGCTGTRSYTIVVNTCPAITIAPSSLPLATVGVFYSQTLTASGGVSPYVFSLASGSLPAGLNLSGNTISGVPTTAGSSTFAIKATDANGCSGTRSYTLVTAAAGGFYTVVPCRAVDTRNATGTYGGPALQPNSARIFPLAGVCGIPPTAKAVAVNLAVVNAAAGGNLIAYPSNIAAPSTSVINFSAGQTRANNALINVAPGGTAGIGIYNLCNGTVNLIIDVVGYFQ